MKKYSFKSDYGHLNSKPDPQIIGSRLDALCNRASESLTPEMVVNDARPIDSPLHPFFEWDDSVAGELYRKDQARFLLRCLVVNEDYVGGDKNREIRAFIHVQTMDNHRVTAEDKPATYYPIGKIMSEGDLRARLVHQALKELLSWQERYRVYSELTQLNSWIDVETKAILNRLGGGDT